MRVIQKIKCMLPFSLNYFFHEPLIVVKKLSFQCEKIKCQTCGKEFAINHSLKILLPWECVKSFYDEHGELMLRMKGGQDERV